MKIEHETGEKSVYLIPENDIDVYSLGKLHEKIGQGKMSYSIMYNDKKFSFAKINLDDFLEYLLNK